MVYLPKTFELLLVSEKTLIYDELKIKCIKNFNFKIHTQQYTNGTLFTYLNYCTVF
jgi:hypothetical protein